MTDKSLYSICQSIASNSKCLSRKIGAVIVQGKEIISTGYNGPPRGIAHCETRSLYPLRNHDYHQELKKQDLQHVIGGTINVCPRALLGYPSGKGLQWCPAGHAERNAIVNAARHGIKVQGAKMYMNCAIPCAPCLIEIINSGIAEIICTEIEYYGEGNLAQYIKEQSDLKVRTFNISSTILNDSIGQPRR